jgi:hypothetical protein
MNEPIAHSNVSFGTKIKKEPQMSYPDARYVGDEGEINAIERPADQAPELTIGSTIEK